MRRGFDDADGRPLASFGMRHRSAYRFCQQVEGAMAFVVSQDGDVRLFSNVGGGRVQLFEGPTPDVHEVKFPWSDLFKLSPLGKLDRIRAATMVQHGANDTNVPVVEAEQIVSHLKSRGVAVEYILFPDEGHGWRKGANRVTSSVKMVEFFRKYLRG